MGFMQALDIVSSCIQMIDNLKKENPQFKAYKVILFGISYGAYLSYLCNAICPWLFSYILDISSYLVPRYLNRLRSIAIRTEKHIIEVNKIQFLNKNPQYKYQDGLYDLDKLYGAVDNQCKISKNII